MKVEKQVQKDSLILKLVGDIDETTDFEKALGLGATSTGLPKSIDLYTSGIDRMSSIGIKAWISYFRVLTSKGVTLRFFECSPVIVAQCNLIMNFLCGGTVESVCVPYLCGKCRHELRATIQSAQIPQPGTEMPQLKCPKCGGSAFFDDLPDEYFGFLRK
jgi:anti-anti-sigma regulatory factor